MSRIDFIGVEDRVVVDVLVVEKILTHLRDKGVSGGCRFAAEQGAAATRFVQQRFSFKTHFAAILTDAA